MSFYTDVICKSPLFHTTNVVKDMAMLEPVTRAAVLAIIADAAAIGEKLVVLETYRSRERQLMLFRKGATKLKNVGVHHYGCAVDVGRMIQGRFDPIGEHYQFLVPLAMKHGMISGRDWGLPNVKHSFVDSDHLQRISLKDQPRLFAGSFYPDDGYHPLSDLGRTANTMLAKL